jgi:hypothetical protein
VVVRRVASQGGHSAKGDAAAACTRHELPLSLLLHSEPGVDCKPERASLSAASSFNFSQLTAAHANMAVINYGNLAEHRPICAEREEKLLF